MIPADVTRLILLRHGEVHPDDVRGLYGQLDIRLSDRGVRQSETTGEWLRREKIAAVYTSDLQRAHRLGTEIARHHGLGPTVMQDLRERHFGAWQHLHWEEISVQYPDDYARYQADRFSVRAPGGAENFHDVRHRVVTCLTALLQRHRGQQIVITAHSGPNRIIIAHAMGMPLESIFTFDQDYCCRNVIDFSANGSARLRLLNGTEHCPV